MEVDTKKVAVVKGQTTRALNIIKGFEINTQEDYNLAGQKYIDLKKIQKDFLAEEREWLDPINKLRNKIFSYTRPARTDISSALTYIGKQMAVYEQKIEAEREAEAKKIEEKVDAGDMKLADATNAVSNLEGVEQVETNKGKIHSRVVTKLVIEDASKLEREFLMPDNTAISNYYRTTGKVPRGCALKQETIRATRLT